MCLKLLVYEIAIPWTSVPEYCILILINVCSLQLNLAHSFVNIRSAFAIFSLDPDHSSIDIKNTCGLPSSILDL